MATLIRRASWVRSSDTVPERQPPAMVPSWYMVAPSRTLRPGEARSFRVGDLRLVVFRGRETGVVRALPAHCQHQGVDLSRGEVTGDRLRCPLHHWLYGDGCEAIPGRDEVPAEFRGGRYSTVERFGMIFVNPEPQPRAPLPEFTTVDPTTLHFVSGRAEVVDCPWYVPVANAFDMAHLGTVHRRRLLTEPDIEVPEPMTFRIRYSTAVTGHGWSDEAMRLLSGNDIRVIVTCVGGTTVVVEATVGRFRSFLMANLRPVPEGVSILPVIGVPRRLGGFHHVHAQFARALFLTFLRRDLTALRGIQFTPRFDDERDATLEAFYRFLCELPDYECKETL